MSWYVKSSLSSEQLQSVVNEVVPAIRNMCFSETFKSAYQKAQSHHPTSEKDITKIQIGKFKEASIFLVNGNEVKIKLDMNFIEGANWIAYINDQEEHKGKIVPINEIWLDSEDKIEFMPYILLHELTEVRLMLDHDFDYGHAHDIANIVEKQARVEEIFG